MKVGDGDEGGWIIFKKGGVGNIEGGLQKIRGLGALCQI